jgi:hypothetical protein
MINVVYLEPLLQVGIYSLNREELFHLKPDVAE